MIAIKNSKNYQNTKKKKERKKKGKWQILFQRTWTFRVRVKFAKPTTGATIDNAEGLKCIVDDLGNSAKSEGSEARRVHPSFEHACSIDVV